MVGRIHFFANCLARLPEVGSRYESIGKYITISSGDIKSITVTPFSCYFYVIYYDLGGFVFIIRSFVYFYVLTVRI